IWHILIASGGRDRKTRKDKFGQYVKPLRIGLDVEACPLDKITVVKSGLGSEVKVIGDPVQLLGLVDDVVAHFQNWKPLLIEVETGHARVRSPLRGSIEDLDDRERAFDAGLHGQKELLNANTNVFGRKWLFGRLEGFFDTPAQDQGRYLIMVA